MFGLERLQKKFEASDLVLWYYEVLTAWYCCQQSQAQAAAPMAGLFSLSVQPPPPPGKLYFSVADNEISTVEYGDLFL